ncbi:hypothetical protein CXB51_033813 [Gossypium anomalum]|uniref:Uncharacterized protein n=1 Tax=Gossypium anomalum TaxID=47600 RepID=A0A8J6CKP5_9ROSI|nr:hypothetical protein CXB51_033813 [Gossypium anomalum]
MSRSASFQEEFEGLAFFESERNEENGSPPPFGPDDGGETSGDVTTGDYGDASGQTRARRLTSGGVCGSGPKLAVTTAPLCSLSCNENGAKTLKKPILPSLTGSRLLGASFLLVALFHPTASSGV